MPLASTGRCEVRDRVRGCMEGTTTSSPDHGGHVLSYAGSGRTSHMLMFTRCSVCDLGFPSSEKLKPAEASPRSAILLNGFVYLPTERAA